MIDSILRLGVQWHCRSSGDIVERLKTSAYYYQSFEVNLENCPGKAS